jgi:TonB family protein
MARTQHFCRRAASALLAVSALLVPRDARAQRQSAAIIGVVRDSLGVPIPGVEVGVKGGGLRARTGEQGEYRITGLLPGPATLTARRLGFHAYSRNIFLTGGEERTEDVRLQGAPEVLSRIAVTAPPEVYESRLAGFNERRKLQVGHFVTRERIERANSAVLSDALREIPGVRIGPMRNQGRLIRMRGATCAPLVFLDGFPASAGEFDVDMVDLQSVEGIEVYNGSASVPPEFSGPRDLDRCGVIAIWSRPMRVRPRLPDEPAQAEPDSVPAGYFTSDQVDDRALPDSAGIEPAYPDSLFRARVGGRVVVEFVVDTAGVVDPASIEIVSATDDLFARSVRQALAAARFTPARRRGRPVRQLVQLPFTFVVPAAQP